MKKHPQYILAVTNESLADDLQQGMNIVSLNTFVAKAEDNLVIKQRAKLEQEPEFRQIIPYVCVATQRDDKLYFWPYRRTETSGEVRLQSNVSIGFGGHIDLADVMHDDNSVIDLLQTIGNAASRELSEELSLAGAGEEINLFDNGVLIDDSNEVGKVHLGVVLTAILPNSVTPTSKEDALEVLPAMSARELLDSSLPLEPWTHIVLESIVKVEAKEVEPA